MLSVRTLALPQRLLSLALFAFLPSHHIRQHLLPAVQLDLRQQRALSLSIGHLPSRHIVDKFHQSKALCGQSSRQPWVC